MRYSCLANSLLIYVITTGIFFGILVLPQKAPAVSEAEQLLVFVQDGGSPVGKTFKTRNLPKIRRLAEEMGVSVHLIDARQGSPKEITITPLMVYQNHRGRSIYQGRTTTPGRFRNFIRTSRFIPQAKMPYVRENIPIWEDGRTRLWAPLKVIPLAGTVPQHFDQDKFFSEALESIRSGFKNFQTKRKVTLGRSDRGFYMDFYPWLSGDGALYLSLAIFSQFDCKEPVFESKLSGPWKNRNQLFGKSAVVVEQAVEKIIKNHDSGDSFDPVAKHTPNRRWEDIGFPLPPEPEKKRTKLPSIAEIPQHWIFVKPGRRDPPMIQFRFPAPLDNYAGEVSEGTGEFSLLKKNRLEGASGSIEVDTRSTITMGNAVLDEAIQGSMLLNSTKFPTAVFTLEAIESDGQEISFGRLIPADVSGTFTLKGKNVKLTCPAEFELGIGEDETPSLMIRSAFKIDLRTFNIEGADGPEPAKFTLLFDVNFILKGAAQN